MSPREASALRDYLGPDLTGRTISDAQRVVSLTDILEQSCLGDRLGELMGRSVLMAVSDQLISGLVMTEIVPFSFDTKRFEKYGGGLVTHPPQRYVRVIPPNQPPETAPAVCMFNW